MKVAEAIIKKIVFFFSQLIQRKLRWDFYSISSKYYKLEKKYWSHSTSDSALYLAEETVFGKIKLRATAWKMLPILILMFSFKKRKSKTLNSVWSMSLRVAKSLQDHIWALKF